MQTHKDDGPPELLVFAASGGMPNSHLPLVLWRGRLPEEARSGEAAAALYRASGWTGTWVYTVYPFWHFHTRGHEVLACVAGKARIGFGGEGGAEIDVAVGDVCVVPAGVGHRRLSASAGFLMAGGYPPGQAGDIVRPGEMDLGRIAAAIAALAMPVTDPVSGAADGVVAVWKDASRPRN